MWDANGTPIELSEDDKNKQWEERKRRISREIRAYQMTVLGHLEGEGTTAELDAQHKVIVNLLEQ